MPEYHIGDKIVDTQGFGDVTVTDVYVSLTHPEKRVYEVVTDEGGIFVAQLSDLAHDYPRPN